MIGLTVLRLRGWVRAGGGRVRKTPPYMGVLIGFCVWGGRTFDRGA